MAPLRDPQDAARSFDGPLSGGCRRHIDEALADDIDEILGSSALTSYVTVGRSRLEQSMEAWVYVTARTRPTPRAAIRSPTAHDLRTMEAACGFGITSAVLTWPNSD